LINASGAFIFGVPGLFQIMAVFGKLGSIVGPNSIPS